MAEVLTRKKQIRAGHRASATRLVRQVGSILEAAATTPPDGDRLTQLKLILTDKLETLKRLDSEIVELTPEDGLVEEIEQADGYKEDVYRALTGIERGLGDERKLPITETSMKHVWHDSAALRESKVKLPKLSLPRFSGNITKWTPFWDSYESAVHNNDGLTDIDKFNYLRSLLERAAYEAISGLTLSSANYREAVEILKKRFGNRQLIISKHMELLLNIDAVTSEQNLKGLRRLYDEVESHVRSLKALGVESETYGALLSSVLLNKLPPELRLIVSRNVSDSALDMDSLLEIVEKELVARERANHQVHAQVRRSQEKLRRPATTLFSSTQPPAFSPSCCYCQQDHASADCSSVLDVGARKQILRTSGRCYNCLRQGHLLRNCRSPRKCSKCNGKHHSSVCEGRPSQSANAHSSRPSLALPTVVHPSQPAGVPSGRPSLALPAAPLASSLNPGAPPFPATPTSNNLCTDDKKAVLLQTARACIFDPSDRRCFTEVRLLFDSGSQRSYITERASRQLALQSDGEQHLCIATFGSTQRGTQVCQIVSVGMVLKGYPEIHMPLYVVPMICEPLVSQPIADTIKGNQLLATLELADYTDGRSRLEVDVLIGSDCYWDLVTGSVCRTSEGPTAIQTKLGWVLSGPTHCKQLEHCSVNLVTTHVLSVDMQQSDSMALDKCLRSFWELESLGIREPQKTIYDEFADDITFRDGRYEVSLPWKEFHDPLPNNYLLSQSRLRGLLHRLKQNPAIFHEYDEIIRTQLKNGIIEPASEIVSTSRKLHYLPHHAVIRNDKTTTKLRVVYDASAKANGPSLNDCLLTGPKFNQKILDRLIRFRSFQVALTADVEKAFLMISVTERDRDVLRFLWVDDITKDPPEIRALRFTRVVFGVSSSPFLLNATIKYHLEQHMESDPDIVQHLLHSMYVDDVVTGARSEDEGFHLYARSKKIFSRGGFNLRKFLTNSQQLQQRIDQAENLLDPVCQRTERSTSGASHLEETYAEATLGSAEKPGPGEHKVLGVHWLPDCDQLIFDVAEVARLAISLDPTKRNVVSTIGTFYDPLGYLAPLVIKFKVLFQKLCESRIDWDQTLTGELREEWKTFVSDLQENQTISLPRSYLAGVNGEIDSHQLCGFCDASTRAYAAVVYLVLRAEGQTVVRFVAAKTRVAPLQPLTIPRLELLSALLLSRLITSVSDSIKSILPLSEPRCFTDSQVALFWIHGTSKEWKPYVRNRVTEIRRLVPPECWSHCPGKTNPADIPSRGLTFLELSVSVLWRSGPEWLREDITPREDSEPTNIPLECADELAGKNQHVHNLLVPETKPTVGEVMNCSDYRSMSRLLRVTAYLLRAVEKFKNRSPTRNDDSAELTAGELLESETQCILYAQSQLAREKSFDSWQKQLDLFSDERGLWRCGGRLANADIPYATKHPILLLRDHPLTSMVVRAAHVRVGHNGVKETLTELRRKFWVIKARSLVRFIIHHCVVCRRLEGAPYRAPPPPPLPAFRVTEEPPFSSTGVDFAGPLYVRPSSPDTTINVWICLFTCCITRAVHLDLVTDLFTGTFIRCLK